MVFGCQRLYGGRIDGEDDCGVLDIVGVDAVDLGQVAFFSWLDVEGRSCGFASG